MCVCVCVCARARTREPRAACLFDHGLNLETPEKVPFRLTQSLIHTFGVSGADGVFRRVCELTLGQLRANKLTILTILSTLRHDPLVEWSKRNLQEDQAGTRESDEAEREVEKVRPTISLAALAH